MTALGLDVGTSAVKGVVVDAAGRALATARRAYRLDLPAPGRVELPPGRVLAAVATVLATLAAAAEEAGSPVQAIAVSGSGDEVCAVDASGRPVGNVIVALDTRSEREGRYLAGLIGSQPLFERTGLSQLGMTPLARLLWLRVHEPLLATRITRLLAWPELIALSLGVEPRSEPTLAGRTLVWDLRAGAYATDLPALLDIGADLFAPVTSTGAVLGAVAAPAAERLGLRRGVVLVAGGFDQALATLGAGALDPGTAHTGMGSWEAVSVVLDRALTTPALRRVGWSIGRSAGGSGAYLAMASYIGGAAVQWVSGLTAPDRPTGQSPSIGRLLREVPDRPVRTLFLPHLAGATSPRMDPTARGAVLGLDLATTRGELLGAVLEALAIQLRLTIEPLAAAGVRLERLRVTGGGARSRRWMQLKADVTGLPVERPEVREAGAFGAALIAGAACGFWPSATEAARALVRVGEAAVPRPSLAEHYAERALLHGALHESIRRWRQAGTSPTPGEAAERSSRATRPGRGGGSA